MDVGAIDGLARAIKVRGGAALPFFLTPFSFMIMENLYKDRERSYRMTSRPSRTEPCVQAYNGGVVLVSHDFRLIDQVADQIWVCENKKVTRWRGTIREYKTKLAKAMGYTHI